MGNYDKFGAFNATLIPFLLSIQSDLKLSIKFLFKGIEKRGFDPVGDPFEEPFNQ